MAESLTTKVRRKGKEYTVYTYCIDCKWFVSKSLQCRAFPGVNVDKPTTDTDRAYKYSVCGGKESK